MMYRRFTGLVVAVAFTAASDAWAGSWATQATLANNAYQGSVTLDAAGNMVSVWYQNAVNGSLVTEIWGSSAAIGHPLGPGPISPAQSCRQLFDAL